MVVSTRPGAFFVPLEAPGGLHVPTVGSPASRGGRALAFTII